MIMNYNFYYKIILNLKMLTSGWQIKKEEY